MKKGKKAKAKVAAKDLRPKQSAQGVKGGITNVRANASVIGAATTLIPSQITAFNR